MIPWTTLRAAASVALAACACASCSGSPPAPRAFVNASLGPAPGGNGVCSDGARTQVLQIGQAVDPQPTPVVDGTTSGSTAANVTCSVTSANGGLTVSGEVSLGASGGTFRLSGHVDNSGKGMGLSGLIATPTGVTWTDSANDCTVTASYTAMDGASPPPQPPAPGRVWGHLSCPTAQPNNGMMLTTSMGEVTPTCDIEADFFFEDCGM